MTQAYSNPERANEPYALPDVEIFFITKDECGNYADDDGNPAEPGWYYWYCFPGCLPDSDKIGPFETEALALADAQSEE